MTQLDLKGFWRENAACARALDGSARRVPLVWMFEESFLFDMLCDVDCVRYYADLPYRLEQHLRANDRLEREIGCRPYGEDHLDYMKGALEVRLGATRHLHAGSTAWISPAIGLIDELPAWIARTAASDLRRDPVPDAWREDKARFKALIGKTAWLRPSMTGPVTLAGNLLGQTEVCLWVMDHPDLMQEFFQVLCTKQIEFYTTLGQEELGAVPRQGLGINDDCCCLFSPVLYESFCAPYLERLFSAFAPGPRHKRRQHSDSAMGHLMPLLNRLGVNEVNFGPTIHPAEIRKALPDAVIHGQMPPMLLRNGSPAEIADIVRRDYQALGKVNFCESPAGVISAGTPVENLRAYLRAVQSLTQ